MPGPWEKYAAAKPAAGDGPWSKYAAAAPAPVEEEGLGSGDVSLKSGLAALVGLLGGSTDAAGHKALNMATAGYLPQVAGAASAATGGDYLPARDAESQRLDSFGKNNPVSSAAGTAIGLGLNGAAIEGATAKPAATILGRILQAGKVGAGVGALANPGDKAGEIAPLQLGDRAKNAAIGAAGGAAIGTVLEAPEIAKAGGNALKNGIAKRLGANVDYTPIPNKDEVVAAAKDLGIDDLPKGVLTDNKTFQKLESGLSQSGSMPAKSVRDQYAKLSEGLDAASNKIEDLRSTDSSFGSGTKIQSDLAKQVTKNAEPVKELYDDLNPVLRKIDVDGGVVNRQFGALKRNPIFQTKDGAAMLEDYHATVKSQPELASLKELRSGLHDSLGSNSTPLDEKRIDAIYDAVTKIRDGSVQATKNTLPEALHGEVDALSNQIGLADSAHSSNVEDLNSIKALVGGKEVKSPSGFLRKLGDMKEADIADKASNLDVTTLRNIKDKFPSVFEKIKTAKINDMVQSSTHAVSGFKDASFLKQWDGMDQEMRDLIFDPAMQKHIESLQTVRQAIPPKLGPSGTPEGKMIMDMFNPKRNALDYGIKKTLDSAAAGAGAAGSAAPAASSVKPALVRGYEGLTNRPVYDGSSRPVLPSSNKARADASQPAPANQAAQPSKSDKWANDGIDKLKSVTRNPAGLDSLREKLMSDPKARDLLMQASSFPPGSKALQAILEKIRSRYAATP